MKPVTVPVNHFRPTGIPAPVEISEFLHIFFVKTVIKLFLLDSRHLSVMLKIIFITYYSANYSVLSKIIIKHILYFIYQLRSLSSQESPMSIQYCTPSYITHFLLYQQEVLNIDQGNGSVSHGVDV